MKTTITTLGIVSLCGFTACKKADEYVAKKVHEERVKLANRGVLPASWTEDSVDQFYNDHKGESPDQIVELLGDPRYHWEDSSEVTMKYVIEGTVGNPKITIEFSGFSLKFEDNKLINISKQWGGQT